MAKTLEDAARAAKAYREGCPACTGTGISCTCRRPCKSLGCPMRLEHRRQWE